MENNIQWNVGHEATIGTGGTSQYIESPYNFLGTVARLVAVAFGPEGVAFPFDEDSDDKVSVEFVGRYKGEVFHLYDYKRDQRLNIGGSANLDVAGLKAELQRLIWEATPAPWTATQRNYVKQTIGYRP